MIRSAFLHEVLLEKHICASEANDANDANDALRIVDESSLTAEIMLRKVSDLKVRVLSMFISKAEVPLSQIKTLMDVLSISNNLMLSKIIFADLNMKSLQEEKNF